MPDGINTMEWDMSEHTCDRCGGPRSRRSRGLCLTCYKHRPVPECAHHWVFEPPRGPFSTGVCKLCGERGRGMNSLDTEHSTSIGQKLRKEREPEQIVIRKGRAKYDADTKHRVTR